MSNSFSWKTKFKSIIIVDGELFSNEYNVNIHITPHTANLKEQTEYFERLKSLFEMIFANTITTWRDEPLYHTLKKSSKIIKQTMITEEENKDNGTMLDENQLLED